MSEESQSEVVILTGPDGEHYALQKERLERARISDEEASNLDAALDDDVSGFDFSGRSYSFKRSINVQQVRDPQQRYESFWIDVNSGQLGKAMSPIVQVMID